MAAPVDTDVVGLDLSQNGMPWCWVAASSAIDLDGLDLSQNGGPFWGLEMTAVTPPPTRRIFIIS